MDGATVAAARHSLLSRSTVTSFRVAVPSQREEGQEREDHASEAVRMRQHSKTSRRAQNRATRNTRHAGTPPPTTLELTACNVVDERCSVTGDAQASGGGEHAFELLRPKVGSGDDLPRPQPQQRHTHTN